MDGNFSAHQGVEEKYQYNGIEHSGVIGSGIGLTRYRVHDAALVGGDRGRSRYSVPRDRSETEHQPRIPTPSVEERMRSQNT